MKSPAATVLRHDNPLSYNPPQYKPGPGFTPFNPSRTLMKQVRRTLPRLLRLLALTALVGTGAAQAQANDYAEITQLLKAGKAAEALTKARRPDLWATKIAQNVAPRSRKDTTKG